MICGDGSRCREGKGDIEEEGKGKMESSASICTIFFLCRRVAGGRKRKGRLDHGEKKNRGGWPCRDNRLEHQITTSRLPFGEMPDRMRELQGREERGRESSSGGGGGKKDDRGRH